MAGSTIANRPIYSRHNTKKLLASHDSKSIRSGIDTLRKRIEKHFGDADEEALSRQMVTMVCKECERRYDNVLERLLKVCGALYKEDEKGVVVDWGREDTKEGFKRI
jgi:protein-arginine kinase activator protein McsA